MTDIDDGAMLKAKFDMKFFERVHNLFVEIQPHPVINSHLIQHMA